MNTVSGFEIHSLRAFILHRGEDVQLVHIIRDPLAAPASDPAGEYLTNDFRRVRVNHQLVFVLRTFGIAINGKGTDKISVPAFDIEMTADFDGCIPTISIVYQIFEGQDQAAGTVQVLCVVDRKSVV